MTIIRERDISIPCSNEWAAALSDEQGDCITGQYPHAYGFHLTRPLDEDEIFAFGEMERCVACRTHYDAQALLLIVDSPLGPIIQAWLESRPETTEFPIY